MKQQIFKEGDRVYFHVYGWGKIFDIDFNVGVKFENVESYKYFNIELLKALSFTEYTLNGFSQERPEEFPKKGDVVWVRDFPDNNWTITHFVSKRVSGYEVACSRPFESINSKVYRFLTTKNPYLNENR